MLEFCDVQQENKGISSELTQLKITMKEQKDEIAQLKISLDKATKNHVEAERALAAAKKNVSTNSKKK